MCSCEIPFPVSETVTRTPSPFEVTMRRVPPSGIASFALRNRFRKTCCKRPALPWIGGRCAAKSSATLTFAVLNFSRTSGTEFTEVDVNRVIFDTLSLLEHQFKTAKVRVADDLAAHLPPIQGNAGRLQQVFLNLFLNAKDAMPNGGTLRVATSNGDGVRVVVSDSGTGIAQEHIHRIYDPFFTTKSSVLSGRRGTGLGLSVTYGIIQEHAGKIHVESSPEQGTTFYLDFPMLRKAVNV